MDNFDKKIRQLAKDEKLEIPKDIDNRLDEILYDIEEKRHRKNRPFKVAMLVAMISTLTITTAFGIEHILEYFSHNKNSIYKPDENDFIKMGAVVNKTVKDKNIEFTVDNISMDDNYINIFYTVKSKKNIKKINEGYKDPYLANPIPYVFINGENITPAGFVEHEATYVSNKELKGMRKVDVSETNIKNGETLEIRVRDIFGKKGNWSVYVEADKIKAQNQTYNYDINKKATVNLDYDYEDKIVNIKHYLDIKKVSISPFASKITIKEKASTFFENWTPMLGNTFALFDENNKSLDIIDKGGSGPDENGESEESYEFLKADKDTKSLTLVPIEFDTRIENQDLEPQSIDNLPITFETSEYGKIIFEDIQISDKEIKYTYYKDGVVPYYPNFWFYDKHGNEIQVSSLIKESIDRHTGRYTVIRKLEGLENDVKEIKSINKVSTFTDSNMKLRYDQQVKVDLKK